MGTGKRITTAFIADFFALEPAEAENVEQRLERLEFRSGEEIVRYGDPADGMYFIDDGVVDVLNAEGDPVNEMTAGQYFGEYAIIAEEPRLSTVRARGKVIVYRMSSEDFLAQISRRPTLAGYLLKQVYGQLSMKHTRLVEIARQHRGILRIPPKNETKLSSLLIPYVLVLLSFVSMELLVPEEGALSWPWMLLPAAVLVFHTLLTRRTLEALILTVMLSSGIVNRGNFLQGFTDTLTAAISTPDTASTILIMCMIGAVTALLGGAGGISALKRPAENRIRTGRTALFSMILMMAVIFIDDCLNVMAAAFCLTDITDRHRIPREVPALMCNSSTAICALIPISVWGAYLSGTMSLSLGTEGGAVFLKTVPFNFASILAVVLAVLLAAGKLPEISLMKKARMRTEQGGKLWPEGSEKYFLVKDENEIYGTPANLLLPLAVMVIFSVISGVRKAGGMFALDAAAGLAAALVFMFVFYIGQRLMTPLKFMDYVIEGISSMSLPILLLLLTLCFSTCLDHMECTRFFARLIPSLSLRKPFLLPAVLYLIFTLLTMLMGSSWGMYGIGIPISIRLALLADLPLALCLGAVCAAGITGDNLSPYIAEGSLIASAIGCDPKVNRDIRIRYWTVIAALCTAAYVLAGMRAV